MAKHSLSFERNEKVGHSGWKIFVTVSILISFIIMATLNTLASGEWGRDIGLYKNSTGDISDKYYLEITPSGATFSIWGVIYVWNALMCLYAQVNLCRRTSAGPLYVYPGPIPSSVCILYIFNNLLNIGWLLLWDRQHIEAACLFLWLVSFSLYAIIGLLARHAAEIRSVLAKLGTSKDYWLIQFIALNALGLYAGWCSCAMNLNLAHALIYGSLTSVEQSTGSTIALSIIAVWLVVYGTADLIFLDKWTRYLLTPYIPVIAALSGSIVKNWNPDKTNSIFTAVLLGLTVTCFVIKVILTIIRHRSRGGRESGTRA